MEFEALLKVDDGGVSEIVEQRCDRNDLEDVGRPRFAEKRRDIRRAQEGDPGEGNSAQGLQAPGGVQVLIDVGLLAVDERGVETEFRELL